jgi:hypothetical protein
MKKNQIPMILGLLGVLAAVAVYMLVFKPTKEKVDRMKAEDKQLEARIAELEALRDQRDFFIEETERYSAIIDEIYAQFPAGVLAEDAIREAIDMEDGASSENTGISYDTAASIYKPIGVSVESMKAANAGTEADTPAPDANAGNADDVDAAPAPAANDETIDTGFDLMQQNVIYTFTCDLDQAERVAKVINDQENRDVISALTMVYDESTGLLQSELALSKYYVTGRDDMEHTPASFNVPTGSSNLFSTHRSGVGNETGGAGASEGASEGNGAAAAPVD